MNYEDNRLKGMESYTKIRDEFNRTSAPIDTKTIECDSGYIMLTSNPPKYKCINCGRIWGVLEKTPMCAKGGPKFPETFEQMSNILNQ